MAIKKYHVSTNLFNPASERYEYGLSDNNTVGLSTGAAMFYFNAAPNTNYSCKVYDEHSTFLRLYRSDYPLTKPEGRGLPYTEMIEQSTTVNPQVTINSGNSAYIWVQVSGNFYSSHGASSVMLNTGSTALPYEPYGDSFKDWFYREYETATDTITSLPKTIIGDGQNISAWSMKGNMSQSGTPTPSNPIYPTECGDKTANLFSSTWEQGSISSTTGADEPSSSSVRCDYIPITPNTIYSIKRSDATGAIRIRIYDSNKVYRIGGAPESIELITGDSISIPMNTGTDFCCIKFIYPTGAYFRLVDLSNNINTQYMMVEGQYTAQTMPAYEQYGLYKIPISFNGVSYPIYLSEPIRKISTYVDTAPSSGTASRSLRKYVFTGEENVTESSTYLYRVSQLFNDKPFIAQVTAICSHFKYNPIQTGLSNMANNEFALQAYISPPTANYTPFFKDTSISSAADFKTYLQQQYANGTPVTIWYVLATPTTEQFTPPTIPTSGTAQSFDVDTTLKPSEVSLTWHGWHEHSDTKFTTP